MSSYTIDYLEFPSTDVEASRAFFKSAFDWQFTDFAPHYLGIDNAGVDAGVDGAETRVAAPLAVIRTEDLDAALAAVRAAGGEITVEPFDFPGGRRFHFREPGGSELAIWITRVE